MGVSTEHFANAGWDGSDCSRRQCWMCSGFLKLAAPCPKISRSRTVPCNSLSSRSSCLGNRFDWKSGLYIPSELRVPCSMRALTAVRHLYAPCRRATRNGLHKHSGVVKSNSRRAGLEISKIPLYQEEVKAIL
jgi:hypothetical protein